ncbi:hypothetical protein WJX73_003265 [Symbiochloris irregularis]|uniref:AAA+ ATPase domain-containing protein n=1 Tax=Symbiochloris irregularis TaxID=706552 RepID=A0AAW1PEU5_9CHLO
MSASKKGTDANWTGLRTVALTAKWQPEVRRATPDRQWCPTCCPAFVRRRAAILARAAKGAKHAADAARNSLRAQVLDPKSGMPLVRQSISATDLLRDIRLQKVDRIEYIDNAQYSDNWYRDPTTWNQIDGACLVVYKDGRVVYSCVPSRDIRLGLAMETHGVEAMRLTPPIPSGLLSKLQAPQIPSQYLVGFFTALPVAGLVLTYLATQLQAYIKGDREDRIKMRAQTQRLKKEARMQAQADKLAMLPREMASMGLDEDTICAQLDKLKVPYQRTYIRKVIAEEKEGPKVKKDESGKDLPPPEEPVDDGVYNTQEAEQRAAGEAAKKAQEQQTGDEGMDAAADHLKMRTARVIRAPTLDAEEEEMRAKTRAAMRRMKGVKLQISDERITFDDVAGIGEAKVELVEVVDFFSRPELFRRSGARVPRGVLLCGPPGTGKTLLARAVAGEARVTFLSLNASEFVEMFAGTGAARVRDLFAQARSMAPAIIFIDEIDAVGRVRGGEMGNDERDQTLNQMLTEMDGFAGRGSKADVIVMAATNRLDVLDPALIRPGRFDRIITVGKPDLDGREEILKVHLGYRPHDKNMDVRALAFETQGLSGAQLGSLVNTAAGLAGKAGREEVLQSDLQQALEDERLGPRKPGVQSPERRKRLAVQEAATALACTLMPSIEPVVSVTIVPREKFPLGQTVVRVNEARENTGQFTRRYLEEQLITLLAGRAAEELVYGPEEMSTLNQRRIAMAREIAAKMVVASGMSNTPMLLGRPMAHTVRMGNALHHVVPPRMTSNTIQPADQEMHIMLNAAYDNALGLIEGNRAAFDAIVAALLEQPVSGDEVSRIVQELGNEEFLKWRDQEKQEFM